MNDRRIATSFPWTRSANLLAIAAALCITAGCNNQPGNNGGGSVTEDALSFEGTLSGKVLTTASTRDSLSSSSAAQTLPPDFDPNNTCVRFKDVAGNDLMDPNGQPIGEVPVDADGNFDAENLPVGTDFTVCGDIGKDGSCEIESCIQIPTDDGGTAGELDGVEADPLTTIILAKLRRLLQEKGINANNLPVSPATVVARIVGAYTHLFEESGIDQQLTLEDIAALTPAELAELFDTFIPENARTGMRVVEGNLDLANAEDINAVALAAATVFLRAGFPIADQPQGLDLSSLGDLDGVKTASIEDLFAQGNEFEEPFIENDPDLEEFGAAQTERNIVVYFVENSEPDRNFVEQDEEFLEEDDINPPDLPVLHDYLLLAMAQLQLENRRITINDLYDLLTSTEDGLGARLTYFIFDPNFPGPPLNVFETANGEGKAINLERIFFEFFNEGFGELTPEEFDRQEAQLRRLINDALSDTVPPTFGRLFGNVVDNRIEGINELSERVRNARAHLPFSRSGDSTFFVVADGDPFAADPNNDTTALAQFPTNSSGILPVTVDIEFTQDGRPVGVVADLTGNGAFFLGFTHGTDERGIVEFILRETGRFLHGPRGPVRLNMNNEEIFQPINGQPFIDYVSENGAFYPGTQVTVIRSEFVPEPFEMLPPDPFFDEPFDEFDPLDDPFMETDDNFVDDRPMDLPPPDDMRSDDRPMDMPPTETVMDAPATQQIPGEGPHQQLFVLAFTPNGEPVRVDYDMNTNQGIVNPNGRYLLTFLPGTEESGLFGLFNEKTGREATFNDPADFFMAPPERPDRFEDFFNNFDEDQFNDFERIDEFVDDFLTDIPPDEFFPPLDDMPPPPIDDMPPPPDDMPPPPDDMTNLNDMPEQMPNDMPPPDMMVDDGSDPAQVDDEVDDTFDDEFDDFDDFDDFEGDFDDDFEIDDDDINVLDGIDPNLIIVDIDDIIGLQIRRDRFNRVFGTEVPNDQYDPSGDPYFDDINGNEMQDENEPTAPFRPTLFDPNDWRSTDIRLYYRRADNGEAVLFENVDFESQTPRTLDGVALVERNYLPRLNAFKFGRPNTAVNLLTAFVPPEFFNGTQGFTEDTQLDIFSAIAMINLVMDQVFNVEANIDVDGLGPLPKQRMLIDAHLFVAPVGDPFVLLMKGFENRSLAISELQ